MARHEKRKTHFRITLRENTEGMEASNRRSPKGAAHVDIGEEYGEVLVSVENLKYLGNAQNSLPYYYEGWLVFNNGYKISTGPISIDGKGAGKSYWRFIPDNIAGTGARVQDIRGFAVTIEVMDGNPYPSNTYALIGYRNEPANQPQPPAVPIYPNPYPPKPCWPTGPAVNLMEQSNIRPGSAYCWWEMAMPNARNAAPLLFGYSMNEAGIDQVAFGIPGLAEYPVSSGEAGEWQDGYWMYYHTPV